MQKQPRLQVPQALTCVRADANSVPSLVPSAVSARNSAEMHAWASTMRGWAAHAKTCAKGCAGMNSSLRHCGRVARAAWHLWSVSASLHPLPPLMLAALSCPAQEAQDLIVQVACKLPCQPMWRYTAVAFQEPAVLVGPDHASWTHWRVKPCPYPPHRPDDWLFSMTFAANASSVESAKDSTKLSSSTTATACPAILYMAPPIAKSRRWMLH